jgi:hypothetical protein
MRMSKRLNNTLLGVTSLIGLAMCGMSPARSAVVILPFQDPTGNAHFRDGDEQPLFDDKHGQPAMSSSFASLDKNNNSAENIAVSATGDTYTGGSGFANFKSSDAGSPTNPLTAFTFSPGPDSNPFNQFDGVFFRGQIDSENGATTETVTVTVDFVDLTTSTPGSDTFTFTGVNTSDIGRIGFDESPTSDPYHVTSVTFALASGAAGWNQVKQLEFSVPGTITVPEPATWALMALGFAGLGFAGYRSSRKTPALAA